MIWVELKNALFRSVVVREIATLVERGAKKRLLVQSADELALNGSVTHGPFQFTIAINSASHSSLELFAILERGRWRQSMILAIVLHRMLIGCINALFVRPSFARFPLVFDLLSGDRRNYRINGMMA